MAEARQRSFRQNSSDIFAVKQDSISRQPEPDQARKMASCRSEASLRYALHSTSEAFDGVWDQVRNSRPVQRPEATVKVGEPVAGASSDYRKLQTQSVKIAAQRPTQLYDPEPSTEAHSQAIEKPAFTPKYQEVDPKLARLRDVYGANAQLPNSNPNTETPSKGQTKVPEFMRRMTNNEFKGMFLQTFDPRTEVLSLRTNLTSKERCFEDQQSHIFEDPKYTSPSAKPDVEEWDMAARKKDPMYSDVLPINDAAKNREKAERPERLMDTYSKPESSYVVRPARANCNPAEMRQENLTSAFDSPVKTPPQSRDQDRFETPPRPEPNQVSYTDRLQLEELPPDTDEQKLRSICRGAALFDVRLDIDKVTNQCKGTAKIGLRYVDEKQRENAMVSLTDRGYIASPVKESYGKNSNPAGLASARWHNTHEPPRRSRETAQVQRPKSARFSKPYEPALCWKRLIHPVLPLKRR